MRISRLLLAIAFVFGCAGPSRRQQSSSSEELWYSIARLPSGASMPSEWVERASSGIDKVDFRFDRVGERGWVVVNGYRMPKDEPPQSVTSILSGEMIGKISVVAMRLDGGFRDSMPTDGLVFNQSSSRSFSFVDTEAVEVIIDRKPEPVVQRICILALRPRNTNVLALVIYSNDPAHFAAGLEDVRQLAQRIRFDQAATSVGRAAGQ